MANLQLTTAFTQLGYRLQDVSDIDTNTRIQWAQFVSDFIYKEIVKTEPERFIASTTINVTSGTAAHTLPSDFLHVQSWGTGLYVPNDDGTANNTRKALTGYGSQQDGYYITGNFLTLTPVPTASDTLVFRYIPKPPIYTSINDYFSSDKLLTGKEIIPDWATEYLVNALVTMYGQWDEDPNLESFADIRFSRSLDELLRTIRKQPDCYPLEDSSLMY
jgi:hypothetical protein